VFLREIRTGLHAEVLLVNHGARDHVNRILNWANCMADSAASAVLFYDLRERVVTIELDGLVSRVSASKEATAALKTVLIVDYRY
jgi:hypothetical protein